jgi:hypothetical protein
VPRGSPFPRPLPRAVVQTAARLLPTAADRRRYQAEFVADLHELEPAAQRRYAAGVLSQTFALRAALGAPSSSEEAEMSHPAWRKFRCHVVRVHYWASLSAEDGGRYLACSVCGRERVGGPANVIGA